jgi:HAD superfamily hydrolase (TIGR01549 family)
MTITVVGFDLFGTLIHATADRNTCILAMYRHLQDHGYPITEKAFVTHYEAVVTELRQRRQRSLREVTNDTWLAETLQRMGITTASTPTLNAAVDQYFRCWRLTRAPDAIRTLQRLHGIFELTLVSNFTSSLFLHNALQTLDLARFFHHVIVSDAVGWRKPHPTIFQSFLDASRCTADDAVFIGDELETDVRGAQRLGIKAILLARDGDKPDQHRESGIFPDHTVRSLTEFANLLISKEL